MAVSIGNCFICGKSAGKTAIKNHIIKEHNSGDELCYLLKAEGVYDNGYWLFFSVPLYATLSYVDSFLSQIWCECCGHMSAFSIGRQELDKSRKITRLSVGDKLLYEYDFGSTTEILITVVSKISRLEHIGDVQLLARNAPLLIKCEQCGVPATKIDAWDGKVFCDDCNKDTEDECGLLPLVNSPRTGMCAYYGELDIWTFDPNKPFPQP